jgi:hypothetical protein
MTRSLVLFWLLTISIALSPSAARAEGGADRTAIADALTKLASYADSLARTARRSEDRVIRKKFATHATELADELGALARRTTRDVPYTTVGREAVELGRDAAALVELAEEAEEASERKALRMQAVALEQGIAATHKAMQAVARAEEKPAPSAKPGPMRREAFEQLVHAIRSASFDDDKGEVVRHAVQTNWFLASQVAAVMDLFSFDDGKIDAAAVMWPRITDPENSIAIFNKLAFDSSKEKLRKRVSK